MYDSLGEKDHRERFQSYTHKSITDFSDYQSVVAHPHQGLYMMGTRGLIDIYS